MTTRVFECKSAEACNAISLRKCSAAMDEAVGVYCSSESARRDLGRMFAFRFEEERLLDKLGCGEAARALPL